jgi:AP2-like factor (ANT lineage)
VVAEWNQLDYNGGASELSMLVGSSAVGGKRAVEDETEPKLEDFLGGNSFVSEQDQAGGFLFSGVPMDNRTISNGGSNTMELSMINSWLRNNQVPQAPHPLTVAPPAQQPQLHEEIMSTDASARSSDGLVGNSMMAATGSLALSMSTGSGSGSHLPMAVTVGGVSGGASESTSSENKRASGAMDSPGSAVEAVARKSIDTFGQRTSIYRGVTRLEC